MKWSEQSPDNQRALAISIARNLREFGYKSITADFVLEEIASENRTVVGMMAVDMLVKNGFEDMEG
jgi:hypothetical protein